MRIIRPQKQILFEGRGEVRLCSKDVRARCSAYSILIETERSLVSAGTEAALIRGDGAPLGWRFPIHPNATIVGRVIEIGKAAASVRPDLRIGTVVLAKAQHANWVELDVLRDEVRPLPSGVATETALLARLALVAASAVRSVDAAPTAPKLVVGLGLVGQLVLRAASAAGHEALLATDNHERRRSEAKLVDGARIFAPDAAWPNAQVTWMSNAVNGASLEKALDAAAEGGSLVMLGVGASWMHVDFGRHVFRRGITILGVHERFASARLGGGGALEQGLRILAEPRFGAEGLVDWIVPADQAPEAYLEMGDRKNRFVGLAIDWQGG